MSAGARRPPLGRGLAALFGECRRVLKSTGTLWLVIGDKYVGGAQLGLPWRVALALIDEGWMLRADCIWHKPNAMPSSTNARATGFASLR